MSTQRIIVKIGTNAMTKPDLTLNEDLLQKLVGQIAKLRKKYHILMVTSGAMGAGHSLINAERFDDVTKRQMYAVVGQVKLMSIYAKLFAKYKLNVAQLLATKADFVNRTHYLNTKNCLESLFKEKIIPIMNENDFVAIDELMFTDNDELANMISKMLCADKLILLTNVDGVYDKNGNVIHEFNCNDPIPENVTNSKDKSAFGKGGMHSKLLMAHSSAQNGTEVFIANSKTENVLTRIMKGEKIGTHFIANCFIGHGKK